MVSFSGPSEAPEFLPRLSLPDSRLQLSPESRAGSGVLRLLLCCVQAAMLPRGLKGRERESVYVALTCLELCRLGWP